MYLGGGQDKIDRQHEEGKLTARERINALMDVDSFVEINEFVQHRCADFGMGKKDMPGDGVITGWGYTDGRKTFVYAQDFTVMGGSLGEMQSLKICRIADMALQMRAPLVALNDSGGARIQEGVDGLSGFGAIFYRNTLSSGVIPQISAIMGPCAGGSVYSPALTDFLFMVEKTGKAFITGPQVIKSVTGEEITDQALGGAGPHNCKSGVAHFAAVDDYECMMMIRELLSYLPANNKEIPPWKDTGDLDARLLPGLEDMIPDMNSKPYDMIKLIEKVVDNGLYFQVHRLFAKNMLTGFARVGGNVVGIVANQPRVLAGCIDCDAADKAARFIRFCDCFNIPIVNFVDVPGFLPGVEQEHGGIIRHGAKMLYAYSEATVPKIIIVTRKLYGGAYLAMCSKTMGADIVLAWPSAEIAVMGADGAANIVFRNEIASSDDPEAERKKVVREYADFFASPYRAAAHGHVDMVIAPDETRRRLYESLEVLKGKTVERPYRKHGNIPL